MLNFYLKRREWGISEGVRELLANAHIWHPASGFQERLGLLALGLLSPHPSQSAPPPPNTHIELGLREFPLAPLVTGERKVHRDSIPGFH